MINIQFITDFTCPYCYVARASLLKAVSEFDVEVEIKYLPYEGTPVGELQADVYHDPVRRQQYRKYLSKLCRELLPDAKIPPRVVPRPYTRLAFEGRCFAEDAGKGDAYTQRVLDGYYKEELDIGQPDILSQLAGEVGLDEVEFRTALERGTYTRIVEQLEADTIAEVRPEKIPVILIGDNIRLDGGAYSVERYKKYLEQAQDDQIKLAISGAGCGDNGCGI